MQPDNSKAGLFPPNVMSKSRDQESPYLVFRSDGWTWKVLKSWQKDNGKQYARWFCAVASPFTYGGADLGDTYVFDVIANATLTLWDTDLWPTEMEVRRYLKESGAYDAVASGW